MGGRGRAEELEEQQCTEGGVRGVDSGQKGRGAWRVYAGKLPLEPLLIILRLCPHKASLE